MDHQLAEAAFWSFLTNIRDGVVLLNEDGSVIHVNPRAQELLKIFYPVAHLVEIFQVVDADGVWERWNALLAPPHSLLIHNDAGDIYIEAKPLVWEGRHMIQLILDGHTWDSRPLKEQTREELVTQIGQLRERSSRLARHARQAELLNILAEASAMIANSVQDRAILAYLGEYMVRLVEGIGVALYRWTNDGREIEMMVDYGRQIDLEPSFELGFYALDDFPIFSQLRDEQSMVMSEGTAYVPGPPSWASRVSRQTVMLLPILSGGESYGAVALALRESDPTEDELQILFTLLNQAGGALERVRLFENIRERERFLAALNRVGVAINGTLDLSRVLNLICRESMNIFGLDGVYIWHRPERQTPNTPFLVGLAAEGHARDAFVNQTIAFDEQTMLAYRVAQSGQGQFINSFRDDSAVDIKLPGSEAIEAVLGTPLLFDGRPLGVLVMVDCRRPDRFSQRDIERANAFAVQAATALRNAQMVTKLRDLNEDLDRRVIERTRDLGQERDRVQWLLRINNELTSTLDEDRVLVRGLELVNEVVQASHALILLFDEGTNGFVIRAELIDRDNTAARPQEHERVPLEQLDPLANWVADYRQGIILEKLGEDDRWTRFINACPFRAAIGVPLIFSGEMIGVMMLFDEQVDAFSEEQLRLVEAAGSHVANAIYNAHLFVLIRNQAERLGNMLRTEKVNAAKTQSMLESIADGVLVVSEEGDVLLANDAFIQMFDVSRAKIMDRPVGELSGLYGQSGQQWLSTIAEWQIDRVDGREPLEATIELKDRNKIVRYHLSPVFVGGQFFGTVTIFRDITKDVEVDRMKTEFVSTVSHELRTPLTVVKGYLELLLMGAIGPLDQNVAHYLQVVKNNTNRLQELVSDLLDISRIEAGRLELELQQIDLVSVIEAVVNTHLHGRIAHENKPMRTQVTVRDNLSLVEADPVRIQQVLTNLIDNAFNYTPPDGRITVEAFNEPAGVCVKVIDTGIGIDPADCEKIFERFYRGDEDLVQQVAGTGLGLPIVKSLVEMHGGSITVHSLPERGSEFCVVLPISQGQSRLPAGNKD